MALVQDELVVRVRAETSGMTKEFKKLRKALSKAFNQKQTAKEFKKLEEELADIRRLSMSNPFGNWGVSIKDMEKKLKAVNAKTLEETQTQLKKNLRKYREINKEIDKGIKKGDKISPERIAGDKKYLRRVKWLRRRGYNYEIDPTLSTMNYMMSKYTPDTYAKYEAYKEHSAQLKSSKKAFDTELDKSGFKSIDEISAKIERLERVKNSPWAKGEGAGSPQLQLYEEEYQRLVALEQKLQELNAVYEEHKSVVDSLSGDKDQFEDMAQKEDAFREEATEAAEKEIEEKGDSFWGRFKYGMKKVMGTYFFQQLAAGFVRKVINNFFNALRQGTQNLYEWSQYHNKEFATLMDKSKSMTVALGNAAALFKAYLTEWLTKLGTGIKELLIDALNALSKAIAWITGSKTYIQANKDIMAKWQQNNATTRQLIQGFDKLNIWNGNSDTLPKDMFTEYEFIGKQDTKEMGKQMAEGFVSYVLSSDPTFVGGGGMPQPTEESKSIWQRVKDFFSGIWEGIKTGWVKVKEWFNGIIQKIKLWWNGITTEDEGENGEIITRQVEPGFKHALKEWFDTKVKGWWTGTVVPFFTNLWNEKLKPWFVEAWEKIKKWFDESIEPFMTKLADTLAKWWQNRKQTTNYQIEDWLYDKTGAVIDIEDTLRQFKRLMPWNWGKDLSEEVSFNAAGGVYTSPALGVVGEASTRNNPELVTPTALLDDRLQANNRELLSAFNGMMNGVISAVNGISMEVKIGDDVIARSASRGNEQYYKQMGRPLIR